MSGENNQAPNMYVDWTQINSNASFNMMLIDWFCSPVNDGHNALNTYWAVHQWENGYAGFQNKNGNFVTLLSVWDKYGIPEIEYLSSYTNANDLYFNHEGSGRHIFCNYNWQLSTWYTMCIGAKTMCGKTYYAQWVSEKGSNIWTLLAVISSPQQNKYFATTSVFQEDFGHNNYQRSCWVKNACVRYASNNNWLSLTNYKVSNCLYEINPDYHLGDPEEEKYIRYYNVNYDCDYTVNSDSIFLQCGGSSLANPVHNPSLVIPRTGTITNNYSPSSNNTPSWANFVPVYFKNKNSNKYIAPSSTNDKLIQSSSVYYWNIVDANDGYVRIVTGDFSKAITIPNNAGSMSELFLSNDNNLNSQKWITGSLDNTSADIKISPKSNSNLCICVLSNSSNDGAVLNLNSSSNASAHWEKYDKVENHMILDHNISRYMNPSGTSVITDYSAYSWNFVYTNDDYFYILTPDNKKAVTISGTTSGSQVILTDYVPSNKNQLWRKEVQPIPFDGVIFIPYNNTSMCMRVISTTSIVLDPTDRIEYACYWYLT